MDTDDFYKVLDLSAEADDQQVKEAYRRAAFQYHPDRNRDNPQSAEQMKKINEAYAVLSNPAKRRDYDAMRREFGPSAYNRFKHSYSEKDIFSGSDINAVFEEMAKAFGFRGFDDIFKEYYGSGYRSFEFKKPGFSARGFIFAGPSGKGKPRGTSLPWQSQGILGKISRYAIRKISGVEIPEDGSDDYDEIYLSPEQAQKGCPYAYFHRKKAKKLVVKTPPGVKEGSRIRLPGMGDEGKGGGRSGDLYLKVKFKKPLIRKIREIIDELRPN